MPDHWSVRPLAQEFVEVCRSPDAQRIFTGSPGLAVAPDGGRLVATCGLRGPGVADLPGPKATRGDDLWRVDHWLEALEVRAGREKNETQLLPLITENAHAVLNAASFVKVPARVTGFTWGAEDLAADLGALANRDERGQFEPPFELARSYCLLAAAAAGVLAIDTIDPEIRDTEAVQRRAGESRRQGFTGKLAIHPAQIAAIHSAFTPSEQEVRWARAVLQAFEASPGAGAVALEGRMLDKPHLRQAQRVLAVAGSLSEQTGEKLP